MRYARRGFEVLVINTWPEGTGDAKALVRNLGYGFKLVHAPKEWKHSMGQGANFLIDQRGRVIAKPHFGGSRDLATGGRLVKGLLFYVKRKRRGGTKAKSG